MSRLPTEEDAPRDYARFTFDKWEGLNGKYQFYTERWRRTLEFLRSQHWNKLKEFDRDVLPDWRRFPIQNYTLAFYNDYLTDYLKSEVRYSAVPASPDPHDIDAAELGEQVLKHLWDKLNFDRKRIDLGAWIMATGTGVLRIFWDTNTGDLVPLGIPQPGGGIIPVDPETFEPQPDQQPEMVDAGEIGVEVVSPQFVRWAEDPAHGVMLGLLLTYDEAASIYGEEMAEELNYSDTHQGISADLNQIQQPGVTPSTDERALVIEHYIPPSRRHPEGLWWTAAAGGRKLLTGPWALPIGRIPIVSFRWIPIPGERHIGMSPLYDITFENKVYEQLMARILEWYEKAKPKTLLKAGGGIAQGDLTDEPYQELVVNQGAEPDMMDVEDAPSGLFRMLNQTQGDMLITSGQRFEEEDALPEGATTDRFRTPPQMKSSKAVSMAHISSRSSWREVGEVLLNYVGQFYNEPRVMAIQGPDRQFLWHEFSGEDLTREGDLAASIRVDDIPLFPWNRQSLRDTTIALLQSQAGQILFADESGEGVDMEKVKGALQATGLDVSMENLDPDVLEARNEQIEFKNLPQDAEPPKVEPWQNHAAHHDEHTQILKSMRFRAWPQHARKAFLEHVQQTEQILNQQAEEEAQAMIDQERQLRQVREQAELEANVQEKWAEEMISLVADTAGIQVQDLLELVRNPSETEDNVEVGTTETEG